jgi:aryl-alcohol dehydrogenase-like predicted oxidoreductase
MSGLVFGTAQIGFPYGAANRYGQPTKGDALDLLAQAALNGVRWLDTARAYGEAEARVGSAMGLPACRAFKVVTKISPLDGIAADDAAAAVAAVQASLAASFAALRLDHLDVVLVHRAAHRTAWGGAAWCFLLDQCAKGSIGCLGVSAQTPAEVLELVADSSIRHVQLPTNVVDWRWDEAAAALTLRPDITVHGRSVYLQGLLVCGDHTLWPRIDGVQPGSVLSALGKLAAEMHCDGIDDLCVRYVRGLPWVHGLVLGMETRAQLGRNLTLMAREPLCPAQIDEVRRRTPRLPENLLNPALWPPRRMN